MKRFLICFGAGCLGGLAYCLAVWAGGKYGITAALGVRMAPPLASDWLYPRIVWGGLWGLLFVVPLLNSRPMAKGLFMSIFPILFQLLVYYPLQARRGYLGLGLGSLTPVFIIVFNIVWGIVTSFAIRWAR